MAINFKITPNMLKSRIRSHQHKRYDEYEEGGFDDIHDNNPKCEHCGSFIIGDVKTFVTKTHTLHLYCRGCFKDLFPKEYY